MKRFLYLVCLVAIFGTTAAAIGQQQYTDDAMATPRFSLALGYNYIDANAPPADCKCFGMQGGFASGTYQIWNWLGVEGKFTGDHANDISTLGQDLTLMTFMGGPEVSMPYRRLTPFGEVLFGGARASDSYFPSGTTGSTTSANSFALSAGGGVDFNLTHRFAIRVADVQYLRTQFPNGANDVQNHLEIGAGLVIKFGGWHERERQEPAAPQQAAAPAEQVTLSCAANTATVTPGEPVQVVGSAATIPADQSVIYSWITNGGQMQQAGHIATIDTTGLPPGNYRVIGHAALVSDSSIMGECAADFEVKAAGSSNMSESSMSEDDFRKNVKDAFFDYDSYSIRPDALEALDQDVTYLTAHPDLQVTIGGYADERGSAEFNLALGLDRANAARKMLIDHGVAESRIEVISYGKEKQFCMDDTESCYQLNRRAQFVLRR